MRRNIFKRINLILLVSLLIIACNGCRAKEGAEVIVSSIESGTVEAEKSKTEKKESNVETEVSKVDVQESAVIVEKPEELIDSTGQENHEEIIENPEPEITYEISPEDAKLIAEKGFQALRELNAQEQIKYTNIGMFYYTARGEMAEGQELIDALNEIMSETDFEGGYNNLGAIGWYAMMKNVEFYDIQHYPQEDLEELNAYIARDEGMFWDDTIDIQYHIEKAYKLKVSYDGVEEEDISNGNEPYVLVVCVDGDWKLDVCFTIMQEVERSLELLIQEMEE